MSHKATFWLATIPPEKITAGSFRVLFHLCDHHNDERDPALACYPSQDTLRRKTGLSNGGLNKCLDALENVPLLKRKKGTIPGSTKRRTYYILGCDFPADEQTPQSGGGTNSTQVETAEEANSTGVETETEQTPLSNSTPVETVEKQTPLSERANSTFEHSKLHPSGEEPVKEPVKGTLCVGEANPHTQFLEFWATHPRCRPSDQERAFAAFCNLLDQDATAQQIIDAARAYAEEQKGNSAQFIKTAVVWLTDGSWRNAPTPTATSTDPVQVRANLINSGKRFLCTQISEAQAHAALAAGAVTLEACHAVGLLTEIKPTPKEAAE